MNLLFAELIVSCVRSCDYFQVLIMNGQNVARYRYLLFDFACRVYIYLNAIIYVISIRRLQALYS